MSSHGVQMISLFNRGQRRQNPFYFCRCLFRYFFVPGYIHPSIDGDPDQNGSRTRRAMREDGTPLSQHATRLRLMLKIGPAVRLALDARGWFETSGSIQLLKEFSPCGNESKHAKY